jgi:flagellar hook protein FlgE
MVKSMYAAIAGLRAHQSKMDVISNNIANVNTWGYKSRSTNFQDAMYQNLINSTAGDTNEGGLGGTNASQLGYGVNVGSITTNFTSGSWGYTGRALDCMIDGTGFFIVGGMLGGGQGNTTAPNVADLGTSSLSLSRVGIFSIDSNGYLVDDSGNYVYGFAPDGDAWDTKNLIPITTAGNAATGQGAQFTSFSIGTDGVLTGVLTDNTIVKVGKIAVASVENVNGLTQTAGYLYTIGENAGTVMAIETVATTTGQILSNYLEMSNVELATDMANMITTQRGYQANTKMITVTDEMLELLVNLKR